MTLGTPVKSPIHVIKLLYCLFIYIHYLFTVSMNSGHCLHSYVYGVILILCVFCDNFVIILISDIRVHTNYMRDSTVMGINRISIFNIA